MAHTVTKQIRLKLIGLDTNAFSLMGAFKRQAQREGWLPAEIKAVLDDAMSGSYDHLLKTLADRCVEGGL